MHKVKIDLTKIDGTIGNLLTKNYDNIMSLPTTNAVKSHVEALLIAANINTNASRRLIFNLSKSRSLTNSLSIIANSVLAAQGNATIG